jgi:hypothetical protein
MYGRTAHGSGVEADAAEESTVDGAGEGAVAARARGCGLGFGPVAAWAGQALAPRSKSIAAPRPAAERVDLMSYLRSTGATVSPPANMAER